MDIKKNVALNLIKYRKSLRLTQADLAQKLSYSDKAISKWERMESVPDIYILVEIANIFGITVDELISPPTEKNPPILKQLLKSKMARCFIFIGVVWLVAILTYSFMNIISPAIGEVWPLWLAFIYAVPFTFLVLWLFWKKGVLGLVFSSLGVWGLLSSVFITLKIMLINPPPALWQIFIMGVPVQALLIILMLNKKHKNIKNKGAR